MAKPFAGIVRVSHMGKRKQNAPDFHSERDQVQAMREADFGPSACDGCGC